MAMTQQEFIEKTGCEVVCDQLIMGIGPSRRIVGSIKDGTFTLTDEGQEVLAQLEGQTEEPKTRRRRKAGEPEVETPAEE
jgi:hypothetical protein